MAVFRIEKTRDYTVMSNHHLKNKNLTLKAKGLMSLLLSLPDDWVHTLAGLAQISVEGVDAIRMAVHELEREGYVVRNRIRDEKGHLGEMEYVVYENPQMPEVAEAPVSASPTLEEPMLENPTQENPIQGNPTQDKPMLDHPTQGNPMQLNTYRSNTHKEKKKESIPYAANPYQSIPYQSTRGREQPSMVAQYKELIRNHIEYDIMCEQYGHERLDEIVHQIVEVLCSKAQYFTISGEDLPAELVRDQLLRFSSSHLEYVFECLEKKTSYVGNIKNYLLTTLYNAVGTIKHYYDINYRQAQKSDQQAIFSGWGGVLNIFQPDVHVQYSFINNQVSEAEFEKALIIPPEGDDLDEGREEMSNVLLSQVSKGNNAQQRSKYVTFSVEADGLKSARLRLEHIELQLLGHLKRLGVQAETLDGKERLQIMHGMMHMDEPQTPFLFDWKWLPATGLSTKDFIAPSSLHFRDANRFFIGRKMASVSFLNILASELSDRALVDFLEMETTQVVTMHVRSLDHVEALKMVRSKLSDMSRSKADEQKKAVRAGYDMDILPPGMVDSVESLNELQKKLSNHAERLFLMTFTILHTGNNRRELDAVIRQAKGIAQEKSCQLVPLDFQQEEGFVSSLPLGVNRVEIERSMTTSETAIFMPFVTQELFQPGPGGLCYGINALSGNIVIADRTKLHNGNGVILGKPGSGKSFAGKLMFIQMLLRRLGDGLICDPEGEYHALVNYFKGQIIRISPVSTDYINPLDIDLGYSTSSEAIRLKSEFILSLCELVLDKDSGVAAQQKSIVDRALQKIYAPYMANPEPENMPILGDLYSELKGMSEPEAAQIATALELYVSGSLNVFNHRTNVQLNNRLVCFDIKQLRGNLKKLGMLIVQDQVWLRVTQNRAKRKTTWFFADEFHLLLGDPQTATYSVEMWKRLRKWGGVPTGITQNVSDLLRSREIQTILENSDFIMLFRQSPDDAKELAERLHISEHQMSYVTQAAEGEGLLIYGNKIIPFINRFPKDTNLYRIMTTKPSEMIQEESA